MLVPETGGDEMAENKKNIPIEERSYRRIYLLFAGLLAATTLWATVDETFVRRPWKVIQAEFNVREAEQVNQLIVDAQAALDSEDAGLSADQTMGGLQSRADELRTALETSEFTSLKDQLIEAEDNHYDEDRQLTFAKALYDEVYYEWKEQAYHGEDFAAGKAEWEELEVKMAELRPVIAALAATRDGISEQIASAEGALKTVQDQLDTRLKPLNDLERRLDNINGRSLQIKQFVLHDYDLNVWSQPSMRVDRCETCHMGINRAGFEDWPQPYTTHPKLASIFGNHDPEEFACTPCHDGQGPSLTVDEAHYGQPHHWDYPMLAKENIDLACQKCHFNKVNLGVQLTADQIEDMEIDPAHVPYRPNKLLRGQQMIRSMQCYACHDIEGMQDLPKNGPQLNSLASKVTPDWTYDWLKNPQRFRPSTRMPNFKLADSEAVAITAFLFRLAKSSDYEPAFKNVPRGNTSRGGKLMAEVGCYGCHATEDLYAEGDKALALIAEPTAASRWTHGPDLSRIGSKTTANWIYNWVKNPDHYWDGSRMPSLRLTNQEAADITAFLVGHTDDGAGKATMPGGVDLSSDALADMGESMVRTFGCYGCHEMRGFEDAGKVSVALSEFGTKKPAELAFGDKLPTMEHSWHAWTVGKLMDSRQFTTEAVAQRMPDFAFSEAEADTMALVLKSWDGRFVLENFAEPDSRWIDARHKGRLIVEQFNCMGCHILEGRGGDIRAVIGNAGMSPPNLNTEGKKVQSDWLYGFLSDPTTIRPWLKVRMPSFALSEDHKTAVVDYFQALEEYETSYDYVDVAAYDDASLKAGHKLFTTYQCLSCHVLDNKAVDPELAANMAPNLNLAFTRLRPEWVVDWLTDPQVIDPGTRMPSYFYSEGEAMYEDADAQMDALRDYLMTLGAPKP